MTDELDLRAAPGFVEPALRAEFPALRLDWVTVAGRSRESPPEVRLRLAELSNKYRGANVVAMRAQPIPHAYRAFYHQVGLDPDADRIPLEQVALGRLLHGGFRSGGVIEDALLISLVETGVPVWALDARMVDAGGLGIRMTVPGDRLGAGELASHLAPGRLAVADASNVHALLFGGIAPGHGVSERTERIALFAVGVQGVPAIHIEEALWVCAEVLRA